MIPTPTDHPAAKPSRLVHGVDERGQYLGLVPKDQAQHQANGPPPQAGWLWKKGGWEAPPIDLKEAKASKWAELKSDRKRALNGTFLHNGNVFDLDQLNVISSALRALRAEMQDKSFEQAWVLADDTVIQLDGPGMLAMADACGLALTQIWATGVELRARIMTCKTVSDLESIAWPD